MLEVKDLAGEHKPVEASLELYSGEVLGVAGLVGSGRTELVRAIFGLDSIRSGKIRVGVFAGPASPMRRWAQGVGVLSEDRKREGLAESLTLAENITLSKLRGLGPMGFVWPHRQMRAAQTWVERFGIVCRSVWQRAEELSGGNQQKLALARLLYHDVDVFLLDEPTRGIDVASRAQVYQHIDELASRGKAVLMVSSYLPELLGVCDRIAVMRRGRLGRARPVSELDEHAVLMEATQG
jgi:ribose transport system ATP-binding protein